MGIFYGLPQKLYMKSVIYDYPSEQIQLGILTYWCYLPQRIWVKLGMGSVTKIQLLFKKSNSGGSWLALLGEHVAPDLSVLNPKPMLGIVEFTLKRERKNEKRSNSR